MEERELLAVRKKLRELARLQERLDAGGALQANQHAKLARRAQLEVHGVVQSSPMGLEIDDSTSGSL